MIPPVSEVHRVSLRDLLGPLRPDDARHAALIVGSRRITYQSLREQVAGLAAGLREQIPPGALLAIWLPNSPELVCLYLACWQAGIVPMPLHQGMKWPEMRAVLQHSRAQWLITSRAIAEPHADGLAHLGLRRIFVTDLDPSPPLPFLVPLNSEFRIQKSKFPPVAASQEDLALILHTSGSNGQAKGVMLSRENIEHILDYRLAHTHLTSESVSVVASCLTQSVGFYQTLALLASGGTAVLLDSYDVDQMAACINRHLPTHLIMVVDAFDRLLHHPAITPASLRRLTFASTGADRVTSRVQARGQALTGRPLRVSYGLTESSWALLNAAEEHDKCLALGRPCPGVEVRLIGLDGLAVSPGEVGEICIRSPRTMLGYLHDEAQTRAAFVDGWLLSGDLAWCDADGDFWFAGRKKHLIVLSSGDNVSPLEVENIILSHPAVSHCAVVGMATPHGSEVPWAAVTRLDENLSEVALADYLRQRISDYKIPQRIVFFPDLPRGRSGKVHRDEARKALARMDDAVENGPDIECALVVAAAR